MRCLARTLALGACVAFTAPTIAEAGSRAHHNVRKKTKHGKPAHHVEEADRDDDRSDEDLEDDLDDELPAATDGVEDVEVARKVSRGGDWHFAIGPYLWASSVEANVSLGSKTVGTAIDFMKIQRNAKFGVELTSEARYRRFAIVTDFMYGVVGVNGASELGPVMVTLDGEAASLNVTSELGYSVLGDKDAVVALEPRVGVRYQRTTITGGVRIGDNGTVLPSQVDAAADALAGARVMVRPAARFALSGAADVAVVGDSETNWSAEADAIVRITTRVLATLGYRTMTTKRPLAAITMHGPLLAIQAVF